MYTDFYKFRALPFQLSPDPRFWFASENHRKAMAYLAYGLNQGEGFVVITGNVGTGKTTLINHLLSELDEAQYVAGTIVSSQLDPADTLRMVATAFKIPCVGDDKATLLHKIDDLLKTAHRAGRRALLVIDEAQNMPTRSLEELRMLSNFQVDGQVAIQTLLAGQEQFRPMLASPDLEQLRQRVVASYHLGPLNFADTQAYVEHRLRMVDWRGDPAFTEGAYRLIFEETRGIPRRINTLCSRLLLFGFLDELHTIDDEVVRTVADELRRETAGGERAVVQPPSNGAGGPGDSPGALDDLTDRIAVLERYVAAHERTIQRGLDIVARYFSDGHLSSQLRRSPDREGQADEPDDRTVDSSH